MFTDVYGLSPDNLTAQVKNSNGQVPPELAVRYMNNLLYSLPADKDGNVSYKAVETAMDQQGVTLEARLNMAEALLNDPRNDKSPMRAETLKILGQTFGVQEAMDELAFAQVAAYESPEQTAHLNQEWQKSHPGSTYEQAKDRLVKNQMSDEQKKDFLRFENQQYADFLGIEANELVFYTDAPESKGWQNAGTKQIGINLNTPEFKQNPIATLGTVRHENNHGHQHMMAKAYENGTLENSPLKTLGQLYSVGLRSYVSPQDDFGAYVNQAVEIDSKAVNKYTELFAAYKQQGYTLVKEEPKHAAPPAVKAAPAAYVLAA